MVSDTVEKKLGKRLQEARQAASLTQQALCQKAGLSYSTLAKIERGAIKTPSIFTIQSIATALGVTLDELVGSPPAPSKGRGMSKSGIRFVYFDVNGCLVRFYHRAFTQIGADFDIPADAVETAFWHFNDEICRGEMTMEGFEQAFGARLKAHPIDWAKYYFGAVESMPGVHELVEWISHHYGIGLLTNSMPGFVSTLHSRGLVPKIRYDVIVDSSEVHLLKPERGIFELAQQQAHALPEEILFVDDSRANLMAAEKLGWHVIWFGDSHPDDAISHVRKALELA